MIATPLSHTLIELLSALDGAADAGLMLEEAEIVAPMEVRLVRDRAGLAVHAAPTSVRWRSGFEPVLHTLRLVAVRRREDMPPARHAGASDVGAG